MKVLRWIGKLFIGLIALIVIFVGGTYVSDPIKFGRFYSALTNFANLSTDEDWWTPKAPIAGADNPQPVPIATPQDRTIREDAFQQVVDWMDDKNSIGLVVAHKGQIQFENYWPGYDENTVSDTASMHKSILGLVYGFALEDGSIKSLDEPVKNYLTEWADDPRGDITIRQMMQNTSGLFIDPFSMNPFSRTAELFYGSDVEKVALATKRDIEPGTRFQYSSLNSQLLGIILERATGTPLAEYESEKLWKPLGGGEAHLVLDREGGMVRTFCCFRATPREWTRLGILLANGGKLGDKQIIPEGWMDEWLTPSPLNPQYGLQVWLGSDFTGERTYHEKTSLTVKHEEPIAAEDMFFFDGANGNRLYVIPSEDLVIVRTGGFNFDWEESFVPNTLIDGIMNYIPASQQLGELPPIPADQELFWWRYFNLPENIFEPPMSWYEPNEKIAGAESGEAFFPAAEETTIDPQAIQAAEDYATAHNTTALVILHQGKIAHEAYWDGYSRNKLFSSHSMNKTMTGLMVGMALEDGYIDSLDDPVDKYIERAKGTPYAKRTIRQLLWMSSGAEDTGRVQQPNTKNYQLAYGEDAIAASLVYELPEPAGQSFNHENTQPLLLGAIVAAASGKRYADYASERLWKPLGLRTSTLYLDREGGTPHTDCCLLSYPTDWIKVGEMLRNGGKVNGEQLIPADYYQEMLKPSPAYANFGFMIWLGNEYEETRYYRKGMPFGNKHGEPFAADDVIYLDGFGNKRVWVVPSKDLVIMRLGFLSPTFDESFIPNTIIRGVLE